MTRNKSLRGEQVKIKQPRILQPSETNEFVLGVVEKMWNVGIKDISNLAPAQQFVIWSRIVAMIFSRHFRLSITQADLIIKDRPK